VIGKVFGEKVNCPSDDMIFDITRSEVSVLLTITCNIESEPTVTDPKFKFGGEISNTCPKA